MTVYIVVNKLFHGIAIDKNKDEMVIEQLCKPLVKSLNDSKVSKFEAMTEQEGDVSFIKCYKGQKFHRFESCFGKDVKYVGVLENYNEKIGNLLNDTYKKSIKAFLDRKQSIPVFLDDKNFNQKPGVFTDYIVKLSQCREWDALFDIKDRKSAYQDYKSFNLQYYQVLMNILRKGDKIIIMDPDLWLLPELLKNEPISISTVLQIPFPRYEFFRCLYKREEILGSLIKSKLIFQNQEESDLVKKICLITFANFEEKNVRAVVVPLTTNITMEIDYGLFKPTDL
ncbi:Trehalose-6-phosphate synthase component TPS1 subunit [Pseudoloma neurophilia]|uniref:Trehalose-6-phosphate synthase component TPS1 subunit n=1 Tax=Pseudoloma neurophilia TaxID=146866 RepID=A0A0R0LZF0_9MICR|nr:Trehalose-6-phosphate synthase component TPS1 subunit [Pseudoloma neurophilia]